jgi:hypothetical protein
MACYNDYYALTETVTGGDFIAMLSNLSQFLLVGSHKHPNFIVLKRKERLLYV